MKNRVPFVVFGAQDKPNKLVIGYRDKKMPNSATVSVCELNQEFNKDLAFGQQVNAPITDINNCKDVIESEYFRMHFMNRAMLLGFIDALYRADQMMLNSEIGYEWKGEDNGKVLSVLSNDKSGLFDFEF